ncbi:unnamed protein product, partial [Amoebophrya sp. A120]|eukprot:GSA120T00020503001.1
MSREDHDDLPEDSNPDEDELNSNGDEALDEEDAPEGEEHNAATAAGGSEVQVRPRKKNLSA